MTVTLSGLERLIVKLKAALRKYGKHSMSAKYGICRYEVKRQLSGEPADEQLDCTCGFNKALKI